MTTPTPEPMPVDMERNVTLSGLDLFQDCITSLEATCTILAGMPPGARQFKSCFTNLIVINRPGVSYAVLCVDIYYYYFVSGLLRAECGLSDSGGDNRQ